MGKAGEKDSSCDCGRYSGTFKRNTRVVKWFGCGGAVCCDNVKRLRSGSDCAGAPKGRRRHGKSTETPDYGRGEAHQWFMDAECEKQIKLYAGNKF